MEFDTGALSAFQGGLSQGSQIVQARQAHQLALQRMAMAQAAEQAQQQYQQQQLQQGQQRIDQQGQYNNARLGMTAQAAQQKQQGIQATQQGNADIFTRGALAPAAGEQYMSGDHSPDSFFDTAQNLQQAQQAFGQMSPQAQEPSIRAMYAQQGQTRAADIKMQIANQVRDNKLKALHAWAQTNNAPPALVAREEQKILGGFDPGETMTPQMYQQWPGFQSIAPENQQAALDYVGQTGKAPPKEFFAPKQAAGQVQRPSNDPAVAVAAAGIKMAQSQWQTAYAKHQAAEHALNGFMAANRDTLAAATSKTATPEQKQVAQQLLALRQTAERTTQELDKAQMSLSAAHQANVGAIQNFGQRQGGQKMDPDTASQQAWKELGPGADPKQVHQRVLQLIGGQGHSTARPTGTDNPYDDQRAEPDDETDPFEPEPDDDTDDEGY